MKISELKKYQKVNRSSRDEFGNRIYEEIEFEKVYDPSVTHLNWRFLSKFTDIGFVIVIQLLLSKIGLIKTNNIWFDLCILLVLIIVISSILESTIGSSFGKLLFNLEVVNDHCKHLTLKNSIYRNSYSFVIIFILFFPHGAVGFEAFYSKWLRKRQIYIIRRTERKRILKMMKTQA